MQHYAISRQFLVVLLFTFSSNLQLLRERDHKVAASTITAQHYTPLPPSSTRGLFIVNQRVSRVLKHKL